MDDFEGIAAGRLKDPEKAAVVAHYERAAPLLALNFPNMPLVSSYHIDGLGKPPRFRELWKPGELPHIMSEVDVLTVHGEHHTYLGLTANAVQWLAYRNAVGMLSWTPSAVDPQRVGYARILLRRCAQATEEQLKYALVAVRKTLQESRLDGIPVLDGHDGAALFVPFGDMPLYDAVREWLHVLCAEAVELYARTAHRSPARSRPRRPRAPFGEDERGGTIQRAAILARWRSEARHGDPASVG